MVKHNCKGSRTNRLRALKQNRKAYLGNPCIKCKRRQKFVSGSNCVACTTQRGKIFNKTYMKTKRYYDYQLRKFFHIDLEQFQQLSRIQKGLCAVCKRKPTGKRWRLCVDHNHKTGKIRGLLCIKCNAALGQLDENVSFMKNLITYIRRY